MIRLLTFTFLCYCIGSLPILAKPKDVQVTLIGHRGSGLPAKNGNEPIGNTLNAIQQGIDHGADWIEIDIRQSKDGALMVFHDATVDRNTNRTGALDTFTKDELQKLDLNVAQPEPEKIPTLETVLQQFAPQGTRFILDIKVHGIRADLSWPWTLDRSRRFFRCSLEGFPMEVQTAVIVCCGW